jgi:hypothetical protein
MGYASYFFTPEQSATEANEVNEGFSFKARLLR